MAFADGALDEPGRTAVARHIEADPDARRIVESYRRTAALARRAFDEAYTAEPPKALVDAILGRSVPTPAQAPAPDNVITFRRFEWKTGQVALPIAASIALVVGIGAGLLLGRPSDTAADVALGPQPEGSVLAEVLERAPTGERRDRLVVMASFRDRLDRPCREIEVVAETGAGLPEVAAVACRQRDGTWIVEGAARLAHQATSPDQGFVPSGARESDALGSLLTLLGAKPVLTPVEERVLIDRGWD